MKTKAAISILLSLLLAFALMPATVFAAPEAISSDIMMIFAINTAPAENGTVEVSSERGSTGSDITVTATPAEGYAVESATLVGASGTEYALTDEGEGVYSFKMPSEEVTVTVVFAAVDEVEPEPEPVELPFEDVTEDDWFYNDVYYVYANNLMNGVLPNSFCPSDVMTRSMVVTVLARADGVAAVEGEDWAAAGLEWAIANGITDGNGMDESVTREQLAVMLYRYAEYKGMDVAVDAESVVVNADEVSDWAYDAVVWAVANGFISGDAEGAINAGAYATRAEAAAMIARFCAVVDAAEETTEATEETTEVTEETTEATEETTEVTEETTEATEETTEATDDTTEATEDTTGAAEEVTDAE